MIAAFSISPGGAGGSVSESVAECVRIVRDSGLPNETNAMFTNIEGSWEEIQTLVGECIEAMEARGVPRIGVVLKIDHRPGHEDMLHAKVASVENRLAEGD